MPEFQLYDIGIKTVWSLGVVQIEPFLAEPFFHPTKYKGIDDEDSLF